MRSDDTHPDSRGRAPSHSLATVGKSILAVVGALVAIAGLLKVFHPALAGWSMVRALSVALISLALTAYGIFRLRAHQGRPRDLLGTALSAVGLLMLFGTISVVVTWYERPVADELEHPPRAPEPAPPRQPTPPDAEPAVEDVRITLAVEQHGLAVMVLGTVTVAGPATGDLRVVVDWGDTTTPGAVVEQLDDFQLFHHYRVPGSYEILVAVVDEDEQQRSFEQVTVSALEHDVYERAAIAAEERFDPGVSTAYITTALDCVDAVLGIPLVEQQLGPRLLVTRDGVPDPTLKALEQLQAQSITIIGGRDRVSEPVERQLRTATGVTVSRLAGQDRVRTALDTSRAAFPAGATVVYIASAAGFADMLAAVPLSAARLGPTLLVPEEGLHDDLLHELLRLQPDVVRIIGGVEAVSPGVEGALHGIAGTVERVHGPNRHRTAVAVSQDLFPEGSEAVFLSVDVDCTTPLIDMDLAEFRRGPILFLNPTSVPPVTLQEIERLEAVEFRVLGQPDRVDSGVIGELQDVIRPE